MSADEVFLRELEARLAENRRVMASGWLPRPLWGVASYFGFHSLRVLVLVSLVIAMVGFWWFGEIVMRVSRWLLWI